MVRAGLICVSAALVGALLIISPVGMSRGHAAGGASLKPAAPASAQCQTTKTQTVCTGSVNLSATRVDAGDVCNGGAFKILQSDTAVVHYELHYNSANLVIQGVYQQDMTGTWSNSASGKSVNFNLHNTTTITPGKPNDLSSVTVSESGMNFTTSAPGVGLVPHGLSEIGFDPSAIHGPMDFFQDFDSSIPALCSALS
jgi:hypothetical protein